MTPQATRRTANLWIPTLLATLLLSTEVCGQALLIDCRQNMDSRTVPFGPVVAFYLTDFPGVSLSRVVLWLAATVEGPYGLRLTAREDTYDGPLIGSSDAGLFLPRDGSLRSATFQFPDLAIDPGTRVTFVLEVRGSPDGRARPLFSLRPPDGTPDDCAAISTFDAVAPLSRPLPERLGPSIRVFGGSLPADVVLNCPPDVAPGDLISRGFYIPAFDGTTVSRVDLWTTVNTAGAHTFRVTLREDAYNGPIIGSATTTVDLLAGVFTLTPFDLGGATVTPGRTVTFKLERLSGPATLAFYARSRDDSCPTVETEGTQPPLDTPRGGRTMAVRIWGGGGGVLPDLVADALEVTQGCQDLSNSVRLVADKPTFVRLHVSSRAGLHTTSARLEVIRGPNVVDTLQPENGPIDVRPAPDRGQMDHSFLFRLPDHHARGVIRLRGILNPDGNPQESDGQNNVRSTGQLVFEEVPPVNLVVYRVGYSTGGTTYYPFQWERDQMIQWLRAAYPVSRLHIWRRTLEPVDGFANPSGTLIFPTCEWLNGLLSAKKLLNDFSALVGENNFPVDAHYYAMVADGGGFMRGCAIGFVGSGPTGSSTLGWDVDGTYGDWYGGHEIAHTFGRQHPTEGADDPTTPNVLEGCRHSPDDEGFPHAGGLISSSATGSSAIFGFDIRSPLVRQASGLPAIYESDWADVMTYCDKQWVSDYTYEGLMDAFQGQLSTPGAGAGAPGGTRLMIVGSINSGSNEIQFLQPIRLPDRGELRPRTPGGYAINLIGFRGRLLARYPFTPERAQDGPGDRGVDVLQISEFVPFVPGTREIRITGPGRLDRRVSAAGPGAPTVHVEFPNGGEVLDGDRIPVSWSASDPDGDPLAFCVQYSPDGQTWETVALDVRETSIELDAVNVSAGNQARVRVLATDGINSAVDDSDAPFRVPNRDPQVFLSEPAGDTVIVSGRSLTLAGGAYDPDEGTLPGEQLEWSSSIDGTLGAGSALVVADLSLGVHDITLRAVDGQGGGATASVSVTVVATPQDLDQEPDGLVVRPDRIVFDPDRGETAERLEIGNRRPGRRIAWRATSSVPWISLNPSTGLAPATVLVRLEEGGLAPGSNTGSVRFTSRDVPGQTVTVPVEVEVRSVTRFRRAEANGDGIVDLTDAIFTLGCLFLGTECPSCPDAADSNDSGAVDLSDAVYTLGFLFVGGPAPKPPFPACGEDRTLDSLEECSDPSCP